MSLLLINLSSYSYFLSRWFT